jgi:hypothetical protein
LRTSRSNRRYCLTLWQKRASRSLPKMYETVVPVSTCGRELLRGWWRPIGLMVSFMIFTASVRNILDTPSYESELPPNSCPHQIHLTGFLRYAHSTIAF